jgi:hypothetical protein
MILHVLIAMVAGWLQRHQYRTPPPRDARPPARAHVSERSGDPRDTQYSHALVQATDCPEV